MSKTSPVRSKGTVMMKAVRDRAPSLHLISNVFIKLSLTGDTDTRTGPFHNYFQSFFFMTLLWLGKKQPVSISLFLQSLLGSHKANINHINDIVHH